MLEPIQNITVCTDNETVFSVHPKTISTYMYESGNLINTVEKREPGHYFTSNHTLYRAYQDKIYNKKNEVITDIPQDVSKEDEEHKEKEFFLSKDNKCLFIFQAKEEKLFITRKHLENSSSNTMEVEGIAHPQFQKNYIVDHKDSEIIFIKGITVYTTSFEKNQITKLFGFVEDGESTPVPEYIYQDINSSYIIGFKEGQVAYIMPETNSLYFAKWHTSSITSIFQVEKDAFLITSDKGVISLFNRNMGTVKHVTNIQGRVIKAVELSSGVKVYATADILFFLNKSHTDYTILSGYLPPRKTIETKKIAAESQENTYIPSFDEKTTTPKNVIYNAQDDIILEDGVADLHESLIQLVSSKKVAYRNLGFNEKIEDFFMHNNYMVLCMKRSHMHENVQQDAQRPFEFKLLKLEKGCILLLAEDLNDPYKQEDTMEIVELRELAKDFMDACQ
ncbi:hypothetical protein NEFER03_0281 [Nematocida sp. LUAm3]|nr:hypothetical protein NEFER03_0281 [Nematocida sp. LUAm3]KAI5173733.1 hypothetical protein NEFER02_0249 [Nematocida sp. LUAm2]KAI5176956.1 hypothetical protein NEFER01_0281 [Nematocida sp. LUAm1]